MKWTVRKPAVAGMFYSADRDSLKLSINRYLTDAVASTGAPKAIIVPHAGFRYSGPIAASAYHLIKKSAKQFNKVVLIGPAHRMAFRGLALSTAKIFSTPLGDIETDQITVKKFATDHRAQFLDKAHENEHSLEIQLPFLQMVLDDFKIIPLLVGDAEPEFLANIIDRVWDMPSTLVVISSDLSHILITIQHGKLTSKPLKPLSLFRPIKFNMKAHVDATRSMAYYTWHVYEI